MASNRWSWAGSTAFGFELEAVGVGEGGWKRGPSCERAMKRVRVALRARWVSWKGRRGPWVVRWRVCRVEMMGLRRRVRSGG